MKSGAYVCTSCGTQIESIISEEKEWRTFENDNSGKGDQNRVGMAEDAVMGSIGNATTIGSGKGVLSKRQKESPFLIFNL